MSRNKSPDETAPPRRAMGGAVSVFAHVIWLAQAWVIAWVLASLLEGVAFNAWAMAAAFLGLGLFRALLTRMGQSALSAEAESEIQRIRAEIIRAETETTDAARFGGAGSLGALCTEKLEALRPALLRYAPARMKVMVVPVVILAISLWVSWAVAIVLVAAGVLIPVFMALVGWAAKEASARQMVEIGSLNDLLADRLAALSDLKLIGAGPQVIDGFAVASDSLRERTMAVLRIAFLSSTVLELFSALGVAMVAVWVGFALLGEISWGAWGTELTPFAGILLLLLAPDFFQPLRDLAAAWHDKSAADAVHQEVENWRSEARRPVLGTGGPSEAMSFDGLSLRGLRVVHADRTLSYPDINVSPGDSVALSGPSGVGKTTLLRVMAGLEQAAAGCVQIGDIALSDDNADAWRASVGWMPQSPSFLARSLRRNIGRGYALDADILQRTRVAPIIATLSDGDLTTLGETGAGLSGGEARRVMLARALHGNPALVLADEPTADLDAETAQDIIAGLLSYVADGGTLIVATHDARLVSEMRWHIALEGHA